MAVRSEVCSYEDSMDGFKKFLDSYILNHPNPITTDSGIPLHLSFDFVKGEEVKGEIMDWTIQYMDMLQCPDSLKFYLAKYMPVRIINNDLDRFIDKNPWHEIPKGIDYKVYDLMEIMRYSMKEMHYVLEEYHKNGLPLDLQIMDDDIPTYSEYAIKNTRRRMEDTHVVIPDLNFLLDIKDKPRTQFYAVYDGHGGVDGSVYCAKQFHHLLVEQDDYFTDLASALKKTVTLADERFCYTSKMENLRSGTTAIIVCIREKKVYVCWVGDSQAEVIREGKPLNVMNPHKPEREDEKARVEAMGGCVVWFGAWRVNGQLAVSRAIGDLECKPFVCADADCTTVELEGNEDLICLACDGFWDVFTGDQVMDLVNDHMRETSGDKKGLAEKLCIKAKDAGSGDNISIVVVFLKDDFFIEACSGENTNENQESKENKENPSQKDDKPKDPSKDDDSSSTPEDGGSEQQRQCNNPGGVTGSKLQPTLRDKPPHKLLRNMNISHNHFLTGKKTVIVTESEPHARLPHSVVTHKLPKGGQMSKHPPLASEKFSSLISLGAVEYDDSSVVSLPLIHNDHSKFELPPIMREKNRNWAATDYYALRNTSNAGRKNSIYSFSSFERGHRQQKRNWVPYSTSIIMTNPNVIIPSEVELRYFAKANSEYENQHHLLRKRGKSSVLWKSHKIPSDTNMVINNSLYSSHKPKTLMGKRLSYANKTRNVRFITPKRQRSKSALL